MRAELTVVIDRHGVRRLDHRPPLRAYTHRGCDGATEVWLVSSGATLLEGDELSVRLIVGDGALVRVRSVAAQLVHPCPNGGRAGWQVSASVGAGATLCWWTEPTIVAGGADYRSETVVDVAAGGVLLWADEVVLGRSGEQCDPLAIETCLRFHYDGAPAVVDGLVSAAGWRGPAVLGDARYVGTRYAVNTTAPPDADAHADADADADATWSALAKPNCWARRVLAEDPLRGRPELAGAGETTG